MNCILLKEFMKNKTKVSKWEKEFNKQFGNWFNHTYKDVNLSPMDKEFLTDFIRSDHARIKKEVIEAWKTAIFYSELDDKTLDKKIMENHFASLSEEKV